MPSISVDLCLSNSTYLFKRSLSFRLYIALFIFPRRKEVCKPEYPLGSALYPRSRDRQAKPPSASGGVGGRAGRTEQAPRQLRYTLGRRTAQAPPPAMIAFSLGPARLIALGPVRGSQSVFALLLGPERVIALGLLRGSQCAIEPLLGPVCLRPPYVYISYIYEHN
eukprot:g54344.t1